MIRSRHSGIWSAISANAATSLGSCRSGTSRPADMISGRSSRDRGRKPRGSGWGITTVCGATSPSCSCSQLSTAAVGTATTSASGA